MNLYADLTTLKSASVGDFPGATTHDAFLMVLLEAASRAVDVFCKRYFYVETRTHYFDGTGKALMLGRDLVTVTTLKVDENGDGTYEQTMAATDYHLYPLNPSFSPPSVAKNWIELSYNSNFSGFACSIPKGVEIAGVWGYGDGYSTSPYKASTTTTNEELDNSETGVDVVDGTKLAVGQTILVETEQMYIESISSNTLTVIRGVNGTTAAAHTTGKTVYIYQYPKPVTVATIMQVLRWWKRRESAFQNVVQSELGVTNVYRGLDPDVGLICNQYRVEEG
jgi:hypothetical protein